MLLPNIRTKTLGGKVFWLTLSEKSGWKLQRHILTNHFRILDKDDIRHVWTTDEHTALKTFEKIAYLPFIKKIS